MADDAIRNRRIMLAFPVFLLAILTTIATTLSSRAARADEAGAVSYDACHMEALVSPAGDVYVVQYLGATCAGAWYGVEWVMDAAGTDVDRIEVLGAGEVEEGILAPFDPVTEDGDASGTYHTGGDERRRTCTLRFEKHDEAVDLFVAYVLVGGARRFRDAAVLDWRFLDTPEDGSISGVTLDLYVMRPREGGVWAGENVFVWQQVGRYSQPIGSVSDYAVTGWPYAPDLTPTHTAHAHLDYGRVGDGDSATVVALFPEEWLSDATQSWVPERDVVFREQERSAAATKERTREEVHDLAVRSAIAIACIVALILLARSRHAEGSATHKRHDSKQGV